MGGTGRAFADILADEDVSVDVDVLVDGPKFVVGGDTSGGASS